MDTKNPHQESDLKKTAAYLKSAGETLSNILHLDAKTEWHERIREIRHDIYTLQHEAQLKLEDIEDENHDGEWAIWGTGHGAIPESIVYKNKSRQNCFQWMKDNYPQYINPADRRQFPLAPLHMNYNLLIAARVIYINPDGSHDYDFS